METPILKLVVQVESLRGGPVTFNIEADEAERAALASAYGLLAVRRVTARGEVDRLGELVTVRGVLEADVDQACVVTLEPVRGDIREDIEVEFAEPGAHVAARTDDGEPPDPIDGDGIDVGALVEEHLALGLDPYPRAPGVTVPEEYAPDEETSDSPFAALAGLADASSNGEKPGGRED